MTQPEYEKLNQQCWEKFRSVDNPRAQRQWFNYAFDRAYALGKQEKDAEDDKVLKVSKQLFCRLCADADDYINEHLEEDDSDYGYYQGRSDALHELYPGELKDTDTVIQGWVVRDREIDTKLFSSDLFLGFEKPTRIEEWGKWADMGDYIELDSNLFPDLTWDDDPIEVELIIKRKKKTENQ